MRGLSDIAAYSAAVASGAGLWIATSLASGRREAWDSPVYWIAAYPASALVAGVLGYLAPARAWRWGLAVMLAQAVTLVLAASSFGLLPLGLIMFGILAVPPIGLALLAAGIRARSNRS